MHFVEPLETRIRKALQYAAVHNLGSLMNNIKWFRLFEWIELQQCTFSVRLLVDGSIITSSLVLELEKDAVLIDYSGKFIGFAEIASISLPVSTPLRNLPEEMKIELDETANTIVIYGYR